MDTEPSSGIVLLAVSDELARLAQWTAALAERYGLPASLTHRIDLCLTEVVTNVIEYSYADRAGETVTVHLWCQPDRVVINIEDRGVPFDPTSYSPPDLPRSLAEATIGGRGIRLVRHYANEIHYQRKAGANQLTLVLMREPAGQPVC